MVSPHATGTGSVETRYDNIPAATNQSVVETPKQIILSNHKRRAYHITITCCERNRRRHMVWTAISKLHVCTQAATDFVAMYSSISYIIASGVWTTTHGPKLINKTLDHLAHLNARTAANLEIKFNALRLLPPLVHDDTTGDIWVYPASKFDLGAGKMSCKCVDPIGTDFPLNPS